MSVAVGMRSHTVCCPQQSEATVDAMDVVEAVDAADAVDTVDVVEAVDVADAVDSNG
jgi:hypothetical protein